MRGRTERAAAHLFSDDTATPASAPGGPLRPTGPDVQRSTGAVPHSANATFKRLKYVR